MIRISFIVPCYNVERYVAHCLDSILSCNLSIDEYEIICVNDASQDNTLDILNKYKAKYSSIKLINLLSNVGFGGVRNIAFKTAKGRYVWFVDSDDTIVSDNVTSLLSLAEKNNLDLLSFNFNRLNEEHILLSTSDFFINSEVMSGIDFVKDVMRTMFYQNIGYVWRFLYSSDYIKRINLIYPEGICWEDTVYVPQGLIEAKRIQSSSLFGYNYYFHNSSVCRVMEKKYPGRLIYEYVFCAGYDLYKYSKSISDASIRDGLTGFTKQVYLRKNLILFILRTTYKERRNFYKLLEVNKSKVNEVKCLSSFLGKILLTPVFGPIFSEILSFIYKIKKHV